MNHEQFSWTTSSFSMNNGGDCVEAGPHSSAPTYALRDSKHPGHGHLTVAYPEWLSFLRDVKRDEV